jgi:hypothetical protein
MELIASRQTFAVQKIIPFKTGKPVPLDNVHETSFLSRTLLFD